MKPTLLVIFGFTGDLVKRYFLPALYHLQLDGALPHDLAIMATTRREIDLTTAKQELKKRVSAMGEECKDEIVEQLFAKIEIVNVEITDIADFGVLKQKIEAHDVELCKNRLFYFAIPPKLFESVLDNITTSDLHQCGDGITARLLIEKPFGHNTKSAQDLLNKINQNFGPEHLYPIDHYMAKETVQNILYFRFHNPLIRAVWSAKHVKQIQITAIEDIDIQGRVNFYEQTGALRDMVQSHLLQLVAIATMDAPKELNASEIRRERQKALQSISRISMDQINDFAVRGQYEGYKDEVENKDSLVETYVSLKLHIDNERWQNVPVYLRAGKAMSQKKTEITLVYNDDDIEECEDNILTLRIQPNEGVALQLTAKKPGLNNETQDVTMDYCYLDDDNQLHEAYEKILVDALAGDQTLFPTDAEIINNWQLIEPILNKWHEDDTDLEIYQKGTSGLKSSAELLAKDNHEWIELVNICMPRFKPNE